MFDLYKSSKKDDVCKNYLLQNALCCDILKKRDVKSGHTGRGVSGALYLQSATAGMVSVYEDSACAVRAV